MSLFGSLTTAVSGLTAQSRALGDISDNIANSQTTGYKRLDTSFVSYVTQATSTLHLPGAVVARSDQTNSIQGTIEQSEDPLALAISGQGFFSVASANGTQNGLPTFDARQFVTRAGDFRMDENGYLVNGPGYFLQGWPADSLGNPDRTTLAPIRVNQQVFNPVATTQMQLAANLPADATTAPVSTQATLYDTLGRQHTVNLTFTPTANNVWNLSVDVPDDVSSTARGTVDLDFGSAATPAAPDGTLGSFGATTGSIVAPAAVAGDPSQFTFTADFGQGPQTVALNLGQFGLATGLTQYAGGEFAVRNQVQDGVPLGAYAGLTIQDNGDVAVNYDNGQSRVIARVPIVAFSDPDKLQRLDGQAYTRTVESGEARVTDAASNGVGKLVAGSVEKSNVDIASEFTKLIVAQRAYTANTKVVTASDQMLQDTLNMSR
ncbi:MAG TPA: flagellar hook protein FlgE [Crenalkalicoccus sp.]|jgi:flagellar hook protein FlgE|nr:flagellar hook protein FlgE [Crenalkalicoccus sp.]